MADRQVRELLDTIPFGDNATRRLKFLLSVAHAHISLWLRRRMLSLCVDELQRIEANEADDREGDESV
jgi:hypothetical protein